MVSGIILLDKPENVTSRDMVNKLNHIFDMKKIGHTGTLDPMATGVLVMCLGKYTKMVDLLSSLEKEYIAKIKLGIKTDTLDITGNVIEEKKCSTTKDDIEKVFASLVGKLTQEIPIYSAKKVNGKKLYEYARNGEEVKLPKNEIEIYSLELLSYEDDIITFKTNVSKGTYIRSLIDMICNKLNIIGSMSYLRRTKQGSFTLNDAYTLEQIENEEYKLLKCSDIFPYPQYNLNEEEYLKVKNGNKLNLNKRDNFLLMMYQEKEIAIYEKAESYYKIKIMLI